MLEEYRSTKFDEVAREVSLTLAKWLMERNPELLSESSQIQADAHKKSRADLWKQRLVLNHLVRETSSRPPRLSTYGELMNGLIEVAIPRRSDVVLTTKAIAVDSDLSAAWHPELSGCQIEAEDLGTHREETLLVLDRALDLLWRHELSATLVENHCRAISIVRALPDLQPGQCISLCSKSVPGLIFMSRAPIVLTSESIVHETAHQMLYAINEANNLFIDENARVRTPLRPDPRPISGLLHQTWVLWHLVRMYRALIDIDHQSIVANRDKVAKRLARHSEDYEYGLSVVSEHREALTPAGGQLVEKWFYEFGLQS